MSSKKNEKKNTRPKHKYTKERLNEITLKELKKKYCQKYRVHYQGLNKVQIIENILAFQEDKEFPHKEIIPTWENMKGGEHKITPQIRNFCLEFVTVRKKKSLEQWAKLYGVNITSVCRWLSWKEVKDLIGVFQDNYELRINEKFAQYTEEVVDEFFNLIKKTKFADVKRKTIQDFLGFAGRKNVNIQRTIFSQKQGQVQAQEQSSRQVVADMSDEDINKELEELGDLEE